jgi:allophanate hydrolase
MTGAVEDLGIQTLTTAYRAGELTVPELVGEVLSRIDAAGEDAVWISRVPDADLRARARDLQRVLETASERPCPPLLGIPFAVKDSIDVAGLDTTVGCPAFAYSPVASAPIVEKLLAAGAICVGKTNLDQFASGLVGVRSPYGVSRNPFNPDYIPGGSSSGSAVAVSSGLVSFSLGTDAAGSGRVPAGLNNLVGLKPTRGLVSTLGCIPACRSIDCPSIFAHSCSDAWQVLDVIAGYEAADPYSRPDRRRDMLVGPGAAFRFGVPADAELEFDGDVDAEALYRAALDVLETMGGTRVEVDFGPFRQAGELLYEGPWIADRLQFYGRFLQEHREAVHPVTRQIISGGERFSAVDAFAALDRITVLKREAAAVLGRVDMLVVPTSPTTYTVAAVEADPIELNRRLGYYTNFVNLLDLAAIAVPSGFRTDGLPLGVTFIGPAFHDATISALGARFLQARLGGRSASEPDLGRAHASANGATLAVAVVGAHLSGEAKNEELVAIGASLVRSARTAPEYRLVVLDGFDPPRPGLVRVGPAHGTAIDTEVWAIPARAVGGFVADVPGPLTIGTVELEDGEQVKGFLCEQYATADSKDISHLGGWRRFTAPGPRPE